MKIEKKLIEIPIELFRPLITEATLEFNDGLKIVSPNDANCLMCIYEIKKDKFIEYELTVPKKIRIDMEMLDKVLKRIKTKIVNLKIDNNMFVISDENNKKEYSISTMEDDSAKKEIPNVPLTSKFEIECSVFKDILQDAKIVSDECKFEIKDGKLITTAGELNKHSSEIDIITTPNADVIYTLDYLLMFMNASKYFKNVVFEFSSDNPCKLTFNGDVDIQFILAARSE